jgi:DTW domain-containing protein YfiP
MSPACPRCEKRPELCLCEKITPKANRHAVLFFQHPQEPDQDLGSARLANLALENSSLKVALSVSNLRKATAREDATPAKWGVLYLGSGFKNSDDARGRSMKPGLYPVKKDGTPLPEKEAKEALDGLEGIILLDGTWSQAKTLWWRNSWLLKCRRLVLVPKSKSLYGELRREPRRECLSTIETTADALDALGEDPAIGAYLREIFTNLLNRYRETKRKGPSRRAPSGSSSESAPESA